jgi:hypothetical protein
MDITTVIHTARRLALTPPEPEKTSEAAVLAHRISAWPFVRLEQRGDHAVIHSGVRDTFIARLELGTGALTACVDAELVTTLVASEPLLRVTRDGVRVDVVDADSRQAAERLLRWRIDLERFAPQLGEASP